MAALLRCPQSDYSGPRRVAAPRGAFATRRDAPAAPPRKRSVQRRAYPSAACVSPMVALVSKGDNTTTGDERLRDLRNVGSGFGQAEPAAASSTLRHREAFPKPFGWLPNISPDFQSSFFAMAACRTVLMAMLVFCSSVLAFQAAPLRSSAPARPAAASSISVRCCPAPRQRCHCSKP